MQTVANALTITEATLAKAIYSLTTWITGGRAMTRETAVEIVESSGQTDVKRFEGLL